MNDRFKFRAWNKLSNEMKDVISLNINYEFLDCSNVILETNTFDNIKTHNNPITCANGLNNVVLMQCTGLKDKNGKLIYEWDVVKIKNEVFFIKYEIGSFLIIRNEQSLDAWYEMFTEAWNDDVYPLSQLYVDEYIQEEYIDCIEVIGNIYENKELLEEE